MGEAPARGKEPGNRLGAVGLLAVVVGAGGLAFEVPPDLLTIGSTVGWGLLLLGLALLGAGLIHEWNGPRRWSAVVPGILALAFGGWAFGASADQSLRRCDRSTLRVEGAGRVGWSCVTGDEPVAAAILVESPWARGVEALARGLAERGIVPYVVDAGAWVRNPVRVLPAIAAKARTDLDGVPVGVLSWGEVARELPTFGSLTEADFAIALSVLALDPIEGLADVGTPMLFAFGIMDATYPGHGHAGAMVEAVGELQIEDAAIRVFLGADRDLLTPVARPSIQPTRLASGWLDLLSDWIAQASERGQQADVADRASEAGRQATMAK